MFHLKFHVSFFKTLMERLHAPSVFLEYETLKLKMKHKNRIFQPSKVLIINKLKHKNET